MKFTFQEMYNGMLVKDATYEGHFVTAVKTTGIFCRPVCTARKPKPENVEFFELPEHALQHGYRPCRVCKPMQQKGATPPSIRKLMDELLADPSLRISDIDLRARLIEPSLVRRWFKKNHNMSFHAFQRMNRLNSAFQKISDGDSVTASAFDVGYNSLSGFNDSFKSVFGKTPTNSKGQAVINILRFTTPLGPMYACATAKGICLLEFTDRRMLEFEFKDLRKRLKAVILPGENKHLNQVQQEMGEYFEGKRRTFSIPLDLPGTEFQQSVWNQLLQVPFGNTTSYKQLARQLKRPNAMRAVGAANGFNRVAIVVPCHRVVSEDGALTGYGGGLHRKQWLINFEQKNKD
jgi:AraC family transcriptional regulator, regulatory protein of adaptative response / methylated-DNA-[protein]-cysteine methyltransferase